MTRSIVLIHAVRSSRTMWKGQIKRLRRAGYHVDAPNLPGHGTRAGERFDADSALATISAAVDACPEPPVLVGLSLGGFLSIRWAAENPGRIAALIPAGCTFVPGPAIARAYGIWMLAKDWAPGDSDARVRAAFARTARKRKAASRYYGGGRAHGVVRSVVRLIGGFDLLGDLARIDVPITFVNGRDDPFRRHENRCLAAARDANLRILDDAGHIANLDRPKRFTRVIMETAQGADAAAPELTSPGGRP